MELSLQEGTRLSAVLSFSDVVVVVVVVVCKAEGSLIVCIALRVWVLVKRGRSTALYLQSLASGELDSPEW